MRETAMALLRVILALLLLTVLGQQALRSRGRPRRRWAFSLAAAAFAIFALGNGLAALGFDLSALAALFFALPATLMIASLALLLLAWRAGEMSGQVERLQQA